MTCRLSLYAIALGAITPLIWYINWLIVYYLGSNVISDAITDKTYVFFPFFILFLAAPGGGFLVTHVIFVVATLCNMALYGLLVFVSLKMGGFIRGLF